MGPLFWLPTRGQGSQVRRASGPSNPTVVTDDGQSQVSVADFNGQTGLTYVTGTTGLFFEFFSTSNNYRCWLNTGTETAPDGSRTIEVDIETTSTAAQIAAACASAINAQYPSFFSAVQINGLGTNTACQITTVSNGLTSNIEDGNTGATYSTTQTGATATVVTDDSDTVVTDD